MSRVLLIRIVWRVGFGMTVLQCGVLDRNTEGFCRKLSALWVNVWNQHHTTPHWGGNSSLARSSHIKVHNAPGGQSQYRVWAGLPRYLGSQRSPLFAFFARTAPPPLCAAPYEYFPMAWKCWWGYVWTPRTTLKAFTTANWLYGGYRYVEEGPNRCKPYLSGILPAGSENSGTVVYLRTPRAITIKNRNS